ncbi:MAG: PAS domain-containing protein [Proteobacteria bacterium]|nr:PAS domain-containing protein [Pseudomonadota bacterium]
MDKKPVKNSHQPQAMPWIRKVQTRFFLPEDKDIFYRQRKKLLAKNLSPVCDLRIVRPDNRRFWAQFEATVSYDTAGSAPLSGCDKRHHRSQAGRG